MSSIHRGTLLSFDSSTWTAQVLIDGADAAAQMPVAQWVPPAHLTPEAEVVLILFDPSNTDDGVVLGAYGAAGAWIVPALNVGSAAAAAAGQLLLQLVTALLETGAGATAAANFTRNAVHNGTNWVRLADSNAAAVLQLDSGPTLSFYTNSDAGSTAGSVITLVKRAQISLDSLAAYGALVAQPTDAGTNTNLDVLDLEHLTTGTPAAGFGAGTIVILHSSNRTRRPAAQDQVSWATATDASRKARRVLYVWDTAVREALRMEASGSAPMLGFFGAAAVARPAVTGSRGGNAALASLLTALANLGLITDSTTA